MFVPSQIKYTVIAIVFIEDSAKNFFWVYSLANVQCFELRSANEWGWNYYKYVFREFSFMWISESNFFIIPLSMAVPSNFGKSCRKREYFKFSLMSLPQHLKFEVLNWRLEQKTIFEEALTSELWSLWNLVNHPESWNLVI